MKLKLNNFKIEDIVNGDFSKIYQTGDLVSDLMRQMISSTRRKYEDQVIAQIKEELSKLGHHFYNEYNFIEFSKKRISRVAHIDEQEIRYYLDFKSLRNHGGLLCISHEMRIQTSWNGNQYKVTIG